MEFEESPLTSNLRTLARARALVEVDRFAEAIPLLQGALRADPQSQEALCLLGIALHFTNRSREGLLAVQDAISFDPQQEWPHRVRASILSGMGRKREALEAAQNAAVLAPDEPQVLECLARAQLGLKQWKDAGNTGAYLLSLAPDWDSTHELLGDLALSTRKWKAAEKHYRDALTLNAQSHSAMNNLGVTLQRLKRNKEAIECFHQAAKINPSAEVSRENLYQAVKGYAGFGFFGLWLLLQTIRIFVSQTRELPENQRLLAALGGCAALVLGIGGAWWLWRRRMGELHPTVTAFYRDEQRRATRASFIRVSTAVLLILGTVATAFWLAVACVGGLKEAGFTSWPLGLFLLLAVSTAWGVISQVRKRFFNVR